MDRARGGQGETKERAAWKPIHDHVQSREPMETVTQEPHARAL